MQSSKETFDHSADSFLSKTLILKLVDISGCNICLCEEKKNFLMVNISLPPILLLKCHIHTEMGIRFVYLAKIDRAKLFGQGKSAFPHFYIRTISIEREKWSNLITSFIFSKDSKDFFELIFLVTIIKFFVHHHTELWKF